MRSLKDNLVWGIADPEIMSDLLGDPKTNRTLDETVAFIAQKEQGKITKSAVGECAGAIANTRTSQNHNHPQYLVQSAGLVVALPMAPETTAGLDQCIVRLGHSRVAKCAIKGHLYNIL